MDVEGLNPKNKYNIIKYALRTNNVSKTCQLFGISRTIYYRWYNKYKTYGMDGLANKVNKKPNMPNKVNKDTENAILNHVNKYPEDGPKRIYYELKANGYDVGETGIYNVLKRNALNKRADRELYSKDKNIKKASKKQNKQLDYNLINKNNAYPGYLLIQNISYLGKFKNLGEVYQYTICDVYSKWGLVKLYNSKNSINAIDFIETKIMPLSKTLNLPMKNIVTNNGTEFTTNWKNGMHKYDKFLNQNDIKHWTFPISNKSVFMPMEEFLTVIADEFYKSIKVSNEAYSFADIEKCLESYLKHYNFNRLITTGMHKGNIPAKLVLDYIGDDETLPLWIYTRLE
ncbi:helix-turn-helix domain-containing protein [Clostridium uliginosum]|uniref:Helix-turn-helix domain-containing protein n=1 Tax=Clostridium uliginosum TaxID=119641 RepID=A0A1I1JPX9_9CLOT|nr:helix-turn-helix domain-containing protein [Clostridium uliginosum]SFC50546.1 Helix-turn-helix domain-containing protein [Clostridium uliginosum]